MAHDTIKQKFGSNRIKEASLKEIFEKADVVSVHIPYNEQNHYYINKNFILSFKKDIIVVNTSRGKVLKTEDVVKLMKNTKIKGACLDVYEYELPFIVSLSSNEISPSMKYLLESEDTILTPHVAGWTTQSYKKLSEILFQKIKRLNT